MPILIFKKIEFKVTFFLNIEIQIFLKFFQKIKKGFFLFFH
jgi:hypothetical protein